ncbi:MAG: tryptophan--tRNA ligase [Silvanigrellaceae bacterium]|nr:tryptophan--tRNA ligase [Silvanigrellaceae bacterium]
MQKKRFLTGIKPTGEPHLGNYFGAILPSIELSKNPENEVFLMCADWHGLTNKQSIFVPGEFSLKIIATYLALGFSLEGNSIFLQSDFPEIQEISWYLSCATASGMLERSHAYKDALANNKLPTAALLYYPILMAADILTFDTQYVPVGKDQLQHLEYASDMAKLFNNLVNKPVFVEPKPIIQKTEVLVGTDGDKKMSKSYHNVIPLFAPKNILEKKVKEIKTDSKGLNEQKDPETTLIFQLFKTFACPAAVQYMQEKLKNGVHYGYGHAKADFIDEYEKFFGEKRDLYSYYCNHPDVVAGLLEQGYHRSKKYAVEVVKRARDALGLSSFKQKSLPGGV